MADIALGLVGLAGQLFNGSLTLCRIYADTKGAGDKYVTQRILLRVQECRYRNWGELVGLDEGILSPPIPLKPMELDLIVDVLAQVSDVLLGASTLEGRFSKLITTQSPPVNSTAGISVADISNRQLVHRKMASELKARVKAGLHFALWDKDKFYEFTETLAKLIDGLELLTGPYKGKLDAMLYTRLLSSDSSESLRALGSATQTTYGVLSDLATRKAKYMEICEAQSASGGVRRLNISSSAAFKVPPSDIGLINWNESSTREFSTYRSTTPIMVEWKVAPEGLNETEMLRRASDVVRFLSTATAEVTHLPRCIGYLCQPGDTKRVALVYEMPSDRRKSLCDMIADPDMSHISLGIRLRLALSLAESIFFLHLTDWLHKGIRSDNIIISSAGPGIAAASTPYSRLLLVGFNTSRLDGNGEISEKIEQGQRADLYHHPDYQPGSKHDLNYTRGYDIYSLGICLLEISLWQPVHEIGGYKPAKHTATAFANKIRGKSVLNSLDFTVGTPYRRAVEWCLRGQFEVTEGGELFSNMERDSQVMEFWNRVVLELAKCSVPE